MSRIDLIDTLWNVKRNFSGLRKKWKSDLIDTLWNVKPSANRRGCDTDKDLIDTLWNVKIPCGRCIGCRMSRFNRYIVECKAAHAQTDALTDC